ncbi:DUF3472 domain-containing protein [Flavitalea sp.]|nr:DUF5077 domain-containing protein [Flavitalea sp.]
MIIIKTISALLAAAIYGLVVSVSCTKNVVEVENEIENVQAVIDSATAVAVPLAGNAFITTVVNRTDEKISAKGLENWRNAGSVISTYFHVVKTGSLNLALRARITKGKSTVNLRVNGRSFPVNIFTGEFTTVFAGTINITDTGYLKLDLQGISKTDSFFADVSDIMISGAASPGAVFANDPRNFYWSRRGPSCHLNYVVPSGDNEYFYSELVVPTGADLPGSYFMANGFGEGYFGIQVKSATERWVLFSVWDPAEGNGMTTLLKKGEGVTAQRFGGEGTGGQSYLPFNWKAGTSYRFLTRGKPDGAGNTVYTSWFFAPENGTWKLMATWSRPKTSKYLTNFHGFLENFYADSGYLERKAFWSNQWVRLASGSWKEITQYKFSVDATGKNKQRLDFAGGIEEGKFSLKNGGFFSKSILPGTLFTRDATLKEPQIDFDKLP